MGYQRVIIIPSTKYSIQNYADFSIDLDLRLEWTLQYLPFHRDKYNYYTCTCSYTYTYIHVLIPRYTYTHIHAHIFAQVADSYDSDVFKRV